MFQLHSARGEELACANDDVAMQPVWIKCNFTSASSARQVALANHAAVAHAPTSTPSDGHTPARH